MRVPGLLCSLALVLGAAGLSTAQTAAPLLGRVDGDVYRSPTGEFAVRVPVLPELGGVVTDTREVVTFHDDFTVHASVACFGLDSTQRWEHETRGRRDYLIWFFQEFVQNDFRRRFPGTRIESARFLPNLAEGALLVFNLLPGGSMFGTDLSFNRDGEAPLIAKRGNLLFVHNQHLYVLSIELAEKVLQPLTFDKTEEQENEMLHTRLLKLYQRMSFTVEMAAPAAPTS